MADKAVSYEHRSKAKDKSTVSAKTVKFSAKSEFLPQKDTT